MEKEDLENLSDKDLERSERLLAMENRDKREDAQRRMAWFALAGMLMYPMSVVLASFIGLENASDVLGDMAATYFVSVAAIVAAFYGTQAYSSKK